MGDPVNNEDRAAPNLEAIMNSCPQFGQHLAQWRGRCGGRLAQRLGGGAGGRGGGGDGAKPAAAASAAPPRTASEAESGLASAAAAVADAIDLLSNDLASLPQDPVTQIRSCAFQQAEGRGLTISPGTTDHRPAQRHIQSP